MKDKHRIKSSEPAFTIVHDVVLSEYELGPHAGWLYVQLKSYTRKGDEVAFPSIGTLAKRCGMSKRTVQRHLKTLAEKHLIEIQQRTTEQGDFDSNLYIINDPIRQCDRGYSLCDTTVVSQSHDGGVTVAHEEEPLEEEPLKKKDVSAEPTAPPAKPKRRTPERARIICMRSLGWRPSGDDEQPPAELVKRANRIVGFLNRNDKAVTNENPGKLEAFYRWWKREYKDINPPADVGKFATHWQTFTRYYEAKHNPTAAHQPEIVEYDPSAGLDRYGLAS